MKYASICINDFEVNQMEKEQYDKRSMQKYAIIYKKANKDVIDENI